MKPSIHTIMRESIKKIVELDKKKPNDDLDLVRHENETFYYRVLYLFLKEASEYYTSQEIKQWIQEEMFGFSGLPDIDEYN